jgi:hypothetical protein
MSFHRMKMYTQRQNDEDMDEREFQRQKRRRDRSRNERDHSSGYKQRKQRGFSQFDDMDEDDRYSITDS